MNTLISRTLKTARNLAVIAGIAITGQAQAELYYFHNDHLGTPQVVTDTNGDVVWEGRYDPFGEVVETTAAVQQDLRFPGQLLDRETGLHYNYFRDYDPRTGRYVTSDPIGLEGGVNTFEYVSSNPINRADPRGLMGSLIWSMWPEEGFSAVGPFGPVCGVSGSVGATYVLDGPFRQACENHDKCYSICGMPKLLCDLIFAFEGAYGYALVLALPVGGRTAGDSAYESAQEEACGGGCRK